jgi:hypothetical protein
MKMMKYSPPKTKVNLIQILRKQNLVILSEKSKKTNGNAMALLEKIKILGKLTSV